MGIKSLLPFLKQALSPGSIEAFANKTIGVDISCILYRAFSGCAKEVARNETSDFYITFVRRYIDLLLRYKCHVILVYDGQPLPSKLSTNASRMSRRKSNLQKAEELVVQGNTSEAYKYFQSATSITNAIVQHTISEFSKIPNVDILVSPYEADAQLAYLMKHNITDAVVTDDSDLILFGCSTIVYKLDWKTGNCDVYNKSKLPLCFSGYMRRKFTFDTFRYLCIIVGCDYFPGISNVGFKKGVEFFDHNRGTNLVKMLKQDLNSKFKAGITDLDVQGFLTANYTFLYQIVYCPLLKQEVSFTERPTEYPPQYASYLKKSSFPCWLFAGNINPEEVSRRRVLGNLDVTVDPALDKYKMDRFPRWSIHHPDKFSGRTPQLDVDVVILSSSPSSQTTPVGVKRVHSVTLSSNTRSVRSLFTPPQAKVPRIGNPRTQHSAFITLGTVQPRGSKAQSQPQTLKSPETVDMQPTSIWGRLSTQVVKKNQDSPFQLNTISNPLTHVSQDSVTDKLVQESVIQPKDATISQCLEASNAKKQPEIVPDSQEVDSESFDKSALLSTSKNESTPKKKIITANKTVEEHTVVANEDVIVRNINTDEIFMNINSVFENDIISNLTPIATDSLMVTPKRPSRYHFKRFNSFAAFEVLHKQMPLISPIRVIIPRSKDRSTQRSLSIPGSSTMPVKHRLTSFSPLDGNKKCSPEVVQKFFSSDGPGCRKRADGTVITTSRRLILGHSPRSFREVFAPGNPPSSI